MQIARKISVGSINGVRAGFKNVKEKSFVARIVGVCDKAELKESNYGPYWKFTGEFQGTNQDGEVVLSPVCLLPEPAAGMLAAAVNADDRGSVKFGFDFHVVPDEKSTVGYVFQVSPLIEAQPSNPLADLLTKIPELSFKKNQTELPGITETSDSVAAPHDSETRTAGKGKGKK